MNQETVLLQLQATVQELLAMVEALEQRLDIIFSRIYDLEEVAFDG